MAKKTDLNIVVKPPSIGMLNFLIEGTAPLVGNKFSVRARTDMRLAMEAGPRAKKGKQREPKDFQRCFEEAKHVSREGWCGIPAPAFRCAMISACRMVGFAMTRAKLSIFVEPDGFDADDSTALVRITKGEPEYAEHYVRNDGGSADLRPRPLWREGWQAVVRIRYDEDQFSAEDVANLLARAGMQVGVGAGRPDSKDSAGMGWGTFKIL